MRIMFWLVGAVYLIWALLVLCNVTAAFSIRDVTSIALSAFALACFAHANEYE